MFKKLTALAMAGLILFTAMTGFDVPASAAAKSATPLSNPNADEATQGVYDYLCESFGSVMLSCQQESTWMGSPDYEMDYIEKTTGKLPAIRGLDFMNDDFNGVVERAKAWHKKGGLVTICWHTGINGKGYQESLGDKPDFEKLFTEGTVEQEKMLENWDKAAAALAELRDAGIPVLWRPFHEFDGGWFWWGKGGGDNFIRLWRMMYDRFTDDFGLTNLIWVLGYSGEVKSGWYPGDEYCDIIGSDTYDNSTHANGYQKLEKLGTGKPLAFHECGQVPPIDRFEKDNALWSWFMIWHTDYIKANDAKLLTSVYNDERVITLDELPKSYPIRTASSKKEAADTAPAAAILKKAALILMAGKKSGAPAAERALAILKK
ncbi:MAG: glycoside hydrolase family 26 protein [Bacteroides sp.]|nr:glycoside hydrolase family 26 protein [Eubacterium sp.]MCM1418489.1 glycoside hydrolase family 26 protein [Roseburia sp.]MCM1462508.1 glycoside hydrolase family 26 protein [Bacteroides sp.]